MSPATCLKVLCEANPVEYLLEDDVLDGAEDVLDEVRVGGGGEEGVDVALLAGVLLHELVHDETPGEGGTQGVKAHAEQEMREGKKGRQ